MLVSVVVDEECDAAAGLVPDDRSHRDVIHGRSGPQDSAKRRGSAARREFCATGPRREGIF